MAAAVLLVSAAVLALAALTDAVIGRIPRETERAVFTPLLPAADAMRDEGADPAAVAALAERLDAVAAGGPDLGYDFRVAISCEDQANALALPGGGVVVTAGLLRRLETENELDFVLGHELGHFEHRDHLRGIGRGLAVALLLGVAGPVGDEALIGRIARAALASHGREQEIRADAAGLAALHRRYGHVGGARSVMRKLARAAGEGLGDRLDYTRSHPVGAVRDEAMLELAAARGWRTTGAQRPLPAILRHPCGK